MNTNTTKTQDPYIIRNHVGQYECRLCLTSHKNEGGYLAHTQGKRHQQNLAKRAILEAAEREAAPAPVRRIGVKKQSACIGRISTSNGARRALRVPPPRRSRIPSHSRSRAPVLPCSRARSPGRPAYRVTKMYNPDDDTRALLFQIEYPEIAEDEIPRFRVMSAIEQKQEPTDWRYQYVAFAAEPYEIVCFKVPNVEIDMKKRREGGGAGNAELFRHWDSDEKVYTVQLPFSSMNANNANNMPMGGGAPM